MENIGANEASLMIVSGLFLFMLLSLQVAGGMKLIKVEFKFHKYGGIILAVIALLHAIYGITILGG